LQFWRGTLGEANEAFATRQPKGEITILIEGKLMSNDETPSDDFLEHELRELTAKGHTLSAVHHQLNAILHLKYSKKIRRIKIFNCTNSNTMGNCHLIISYSFSEILFLNCRQLN
jgi:16S rRNA C1402 (ribose-2'-O) methylase RsmI